MAKQNSYSDSQNKAINIISEGTKIKGDIIANGDIRVDGQLVGNLAAKGRLVVGSNGRIEGQVQSGNIEVSGFVKGKVTATQLLNMKASAKIEGDIVAGKLSVEPGATFTGTCSMGESAIESNEKEKNLYTQKN